MTKFSYYALSLLTVLEMVKTSTLDIMKEKEKNHPRHGQDDKTHSPSTPLFDGIEEHKN